MTAGESRFSWNRVSREEWPKAGVGRQILQAAVQAAVTKTRPRRRARGLSRMTIPTSWLSDVRNRIKRSTEKPSRRYFERAETLGWLMPNSSAAFPCDNPDRK